MNIAPQTSFKPSSALVNQLEDLALIAQPDLNLVVWQRGRSPAPLAVNEIMKSDFRAAQTVFERGSEIAGIGAWLDDELSLESADSFKFYFDVMAIAEQFVVSCSDKMIGIRLEKIKTDNCKSFHTDYLSLRLICTYHGAATEWIDNSNVNRSGLCKNDNSLVVRDFSQIKQLDTNWVGLLKGENFQGDHCGAVVHRSPQISEIAGSERLVLRIDSLERFGVES